MKPVKDSEKVARMFAQGQIDLKDNQSGYKYTMTASCPKDGNFAFVSRVEKVANSLSKVIFQCTSCSIEFEVNQNDIYVH
jgi:hypothetical protein